MKNQTFLCLLFAFMLLAGLKCPKDSNNPLPSTQPNGLPLETQEGKNTFGCFWNDTLWLPIGGIGGPAITCTYDNHNNDTSWLTIVTYNKNKEEWFSFIFLLNDTGSYSFFDKYPNKIEIYDGRFSYQIIEQNKLNIDIKKFIKSYTDGNKRITGIVSGNFSGIFYKQNSSGIGVDLKDSITISKAVFDLKVY